MSGMRADSASKTPDSSDRFLPLETKATIHSNGQLADNFKEVYLSIRVKSPQMEVKPSVNSAIQAIIEAIVFYGSAAIKGQEIIVKRPSLENRDSTDEQSWLQYFVNEELDYWTKELDTTYHYLKACSGAQKDLVQLAIDCWKYLKQLELVSSKSGYPQFFSQERVSKDHQINAIIEGQYALWLSRQSQSCCSCLIL
jgi:hypothetical protein